MSYRAAATWTYLKCFRSSLALVVDGPAVDCSGSEEDRVDGGRQAGAARHQEQDDLASVALVDELGLGDQQQPIESDAELTVAVASHPEVDEVAVGPAAEVWIQVEAEVGVQKLDGSRLSDRCDDEVAADERVAEAKNADT